MSPAGVSEMEIKRKNNDFVTAQSVEVEFKEHKYRCAFFKNFNTKHRLLKGYENNRENLF